MKLTNLITISALVGALTISSMAPAIAVQGKSKGKGDNGKYAQQDKGKSAQRDKGKYAQQDRAKYAQHWNPAPPKKNGRHDNRDWNKQKNWKRFSDGAPYAYDGRYYYYDGNRYGSLAQLSARRQQTKNEWRNIAYVAGAVTVLGLLKKDNRLVFAGAAGGLYALHRYEQDRKSQSSVDRARAAYFSRDYFIRDGRRFDRRLVTKDGERYYQFVRRS